MGIEQNNLDQNNLKNDDVSLKDLILKIKEWNSFLKSKWKSIFILGLFGGIIGLTIAWFDKPVYKATLTFAMEEDKGGGGGMGGALGIASSFGIDIGGSVGGVFASSNLGELMKSRLIIEKVLLKPIMVNGKEISLADYYIKINKLSEGWSKNPKINFLHFPPNISRQNFSFEQDSIFQQLHKSVIDKNKLSIMQKDKKVSIISIEVKSEDQIFAKEFCESLAKETSDFYIETKSKKAKINVDVLQKQVDSIRGNLNGSINGYALATDNVYNLNPAYNIKGVLTKKTQIDIQANTTILTNLVVQLELAKIALRKETPLFQLIDSPIFPLEKEKLSKSKSLILGFLIVSLLTTSILILQRVLNKIIG